MALGIFYFVARNVFSYCPCTHC